MPDAALFGVNPPRRCCFVVDPRGPAFCARRASVVRRFPELSALLFFCAEHAAPTDAPLDPEGPYQRVAVSVVVYLAGVSHRAPESEAEAVELVRRELELVGGLVSRLSAKAIDGRPAPSPTLARLPDPEAGV